MGTLSISGGGDKQDSLMTKLLAEGIGTDFTRIPPSLWSRCLLLCSYRRRQAHPLVHYLAAAYLIIISLLPLLDFPPTYWFCRWLLRW